MKYIFTKIKKVGLWIKAHKFIIGLILVLLAGGGYWIVGVKNGEKEVVTYRVEKRDLRQLLEVAGEIDADEKVDLHFQTLGKLNWVGVKEGDLVEKWQVIATLDPRTVEKNLKKDLILFEKEFDQYDQSVDDWKASQRTSVLRLLDIAQGELNSAVLDVEIRNLSLELSKLVSPISGVVVDIDTPVAGVNIITTDMFKIVNPETLYFSAEVDETDVAGIFIGQKASIMLDAYPDNLIESEIIWIDFSASTSEGGGTVFVTKLKLDNKNVIKYLLGLNGDASIVLDEKKDVLSVQIDAVNEGDEGSYVVVEKEGKMEKRLIKVGLETDEFIEIASGLEEGDVVVDIDSLGEKVDVNNL